MPFPKKRVWSEKQIAQREQVKKRTAIIFRKASKDYAYISAPSEDTPGIDCLKRKML